MHSAHDFSVFSPYDRIVPSEAGKLCDFSFVRLPPTRKSKLSQISHCGPGWYHRVTVEYMLAYGIATWSNILWSFQATAHVDRASVEAPLRQMEEAWGEYDEHCLAKQSANQMIGLMATERDTVYSVKTTNDSSDAPGCFCMRFVAWEGGSVTDHVFATQVISNWSYRPIHDQIMATEATRIAQLLYCIQALKIPLRHVKAVKTDALILQGVAEKRRKALQALGELTFEDLPRIRSITAKLDPGQTQLDNANQCHMAMREGDWNRVFRWTAGDDVKLLHGFGYKEPAMEAVEPRPVSPWRLLETDEEATKAAELDGLFLEGPPGVGKTHWLRALIERLRAAGKYVDVKAKTHAAVQNIGCGASTVDHYVRRNVRAGSLSS